MAQGRPKHASARRPPGIPVFRGFVRTDSSELVYKIIHNTYLFSLETFFSYFLESSKIKLNFDSPSPVVDLVAHEGTPSVVTDNPIADSFPIGHRSKIWDCGHFNTYCKRKFPLMNTVARCHICKEDLPYVGGNTSDLERHFEGHEKEYTEWKEKKLTRLSTDIMISAP